MQKGTGLLELDDDVTLSKSGTRLVEKEDARKRERKEMRVRLE